MRNFWHPRMVMFVSALVLSACGGGGTAPAPASTPAPTVTVTSSSVIEGNAGTTNLVFTVSSNITSSQAITINFSTQDGTAQAGSDYIATSGVITFPAGATGGSISVPILGDTAIESDETFTLLLSAPNNASFAGASIVGTIVNDDFPSAPISDTLAPVIVLTGANPLTIMQGTTFTDPGSTVIDNVDTGLVATVTGTVNASVAGTYTLSYDVSDAAGNGATTVTRTVKVLPVTGADQTAPTIFLIGANPSTVAQGSTYVDAGSSVTDNVDTGLTATVMGTVNTAVVGTYMLTYNVSDIAGNAATPVTRTVNVTDQAAPVIALTGANPITVAQGSTYVDAGSSVTDNVDTGLTATVTGTVNTATVGAYILTYNVSDIAGNAATPVTRTVNVTDQTVPVIALTGANPITVAQGSTYVDAGSSVTDNVDTGLISIVTGTVNTTVVGAYTLTYNVSDIAGNPAVTITRTVNVTDQTAPVIALTGASPVTVAQGSIFIDPGSTVTDNVDTGLTATVTGTVNISVVGAYTLTYNVSDAVGNAAVTITRTVNVTDQTAPVIALIGASPLIVAPGSFFTDPGSTVTDNVDAGLTATVTGTVNTSVVGVYTLTYNVSDTAGNVAAAVTRIVNVMVIPTLSIANASVAEGSTLGTTNLNFTVTLNSASTNAVTVSYASSDGTALSASDYAAANATLTIPAGNTTGKITVLINTDKIYEANETLTLTLSNPAAATIATASATGFILNDDVGGMNDTGIITWGNASVNNLTATQALFPNQDTDRGRDSVAGLVKIGGGKAGFDFTKLDAVAQPLANQAATYAVTPWDCVKDNVTGLMWEVKTTTVSSLRNKSNAYTWYNSTGINDAGSPGTPATTPACATGGACDTEKYVAAVNAAGLCGFSDWRLPNKEDLRSIVDYSIASPGPAIDTGYFPNTAGGFFGWYWSSSPDAANAVNAWNVSSGNGYDGVLNKNVGLYVRLVRGGHLNQTAPVIALTGANPITVAQGSIYVDAGSSVTDNVDTGLVATVTGTVNTAVVGTYTLTYNVSDTAGNAAVTVTRTVNVTDQTAPVIVLTGVTPVTIAQGSIYVDAGSSVTDNVDTGLTATVTGTVNTSVVGTYTLTYNVSDTAGNAAITVTRTVNVTDQTAPVIVLTGATPVTIAQGSTYVDAGSSVTDNVDTGLTATVTGTVNITVAGAYTLTYNVSDAAGNTAIAVTRTVNVVTDQTAPVIALTGANPVTVAQGSTYVDAGSSVTDNVDTGLIATVTGTVNTTVLGTYTLTYNVSDITGNAATPVTRTVNVTDQTAPVITLRGANPAIHAQNFIYVDAGAILTDNVPGALNATVTGTVNTAVLGTYTLTYNVSDIAGNAATPVTRTVKVAIPALSIADAPSVVEGTPGILGGQALNFTVTLNANTAGLSQVTATYIVSNGTAVVGSDYPQTSGQVSLMGAAGNTTFTIRVPILGDVLYEPNETVIVTLSSPAGATIAKASATGIILNDDVGAINDTGITAWGDATFNNLTATQTFFPNQDADIGRDVWLRIGSMPLGFYFTKLNAGGLPLANQAATYAAAPWDCVQDDVTGLMWEVKTTVPSSLRNQNNIYTWYNSTGVNDGGRPGTPVGVPACAIGGSCDTEKYVAAVNAAGLCGFSDWRLPNKEDLRSIVDYSVAPPGPTIDTGYFPNAVGGWGGLYWSSSPDASGGRRAWPVNFLNGGSNAYGKNTRFAVRLVRVGGIGR